MSENVKYIRPPPGPSRAISLQFEFVADYDGTLIWARRKAPPPVGQRMVDGSIYAGISPDTGGPMFVMPHDVLKGKTWHEAMRPAKRLSAHRHKDWRLPSMSELKVLFANRAAIGGFVEVRDDDWSDCYFSTETATWPGERSPTHVHALSFTEGQLASSPIECTGFSFRFVRTPQA